MRYTKKQFQAFLNSAPGRKATQGTYDYGYKIGFERGKLEVIDSILVTLGVEQTLRDLEERIGSLEADR